MKTKEELNAIKEEVETLNKKLAELSDDELKQVTGGGQLPGSDQRPLQKEEDELLRRKQEYDTALMK